MKDIFRVIKIPKIVSEEEDNYVYKLQTEIGVKVISSFDLEIF